MVRLVFRPYTQVWRAICTLAPLRASIRVSPDFTLLRHSSPSFGSYQICYYSNPFCSGRSMLLLALRTFHFHFAYRFFTCTLAYRIDSLVRVSRRDGKNHFGKITVVPQAYHILSGKAFFDALNLILPSALVKHLWYNHICFSVRKSVLPLPSQRFQIFSLSFQSPFHLSFTVLVRYRFPIYI